jgi:hypothetical protein
MLITMDHPMAAKIKIFDENGKLVGRVVEYDTESKIAKVMDLSKWEDYGFGGKKRNIIYRLVHFPNSKAMLEEKELKD